MKWTVENCWHVEHALDRERNLGKAIPPKSERLEVRKHSAPGVIGRAFESGNAYQIQECFHYNGSGPDTFGGAEKWPVLEITIPFEEGQFEKRTQFLKRFKEWISLELHK